MRLMAASGLHDFSLKDIQKPEYKRLLRIFSAVINFAKFREEKVVAYDEFVQRTVRSP
jgi:kinetochore protein Nuf2